MRLVGTAAESRVRGWGARGQGVGRGAGRGFLELGAVAGIELAKVVIDEVIFPKLDALRRFGLVLIAGARGKSYKREQIAEPARDSIRQAARREPSLMQGDAFVARVDVDIENGTDTCVSDIHAGISDCP